MFFIPCDNWYCMKSLPIRSFSGRHCISLYSVQMLENMDQKNSEYALISGSAEDISFFKSLSLSRYIFNGDVVAFFAASVLKEVSFMHYLHNSSTLLIPKFKNKTDYASKIFVTNFTYLALPDVP